MCLFAVLCGTTIHADSSEYVEELVQANDTFAFNLYSSCSDVKGNFIVSPLSISMALGMTSAGASGITLEQMRETMSVAQNEETFHEAFRELRSSIGSSLRGSKVVLNLCNSVWVQKNSDVMPGFTECLLNNYGSQLREADFVNDSSSAIKEVNAWVKKQTQGRIENMLGSDQVSTEAAFILVNTIFFKGKWHSKFKRRATRSEPFFVTSGQQVMIPMMWQTGSFNYFSNAEVSLLELPYIRGRFSMVIFLPNKSDGLSDLEKNMDLEKVNSWLKARRKKEVQVYLPRFSFRSNCSLKDGLSKMGMPDAFHNGKADFSRISSRQTLFLASVLHCAGVEADEDGTTAWAATTVSGNFEGASPAMLFKANHPFVFMITENTTGSVLFLGRVSDPSQ